MKPETEKKVQSAVESIVRMMEAGTFPEAIAKTVLHRQATDAPSGKWSLGNLLLMLSAGTTDARGYDQWRQVGRQVRKGAKALHILGPATRKIAEIDENGNRVERFAVTGFFTIPVFRYEDTEGEPVQLPDYRPATLPPLYHVAQAYGVQVNYGPFVDRYYGYFKPSSNNIMLCTHDISTFFHELGHAVHHTIHPLRGGQDPMQEIVAETVAATLCHLYGFDGYIARAADYITRYAKENPAKAIMKVLSDVQKVLDLIVSVPAPAESLTA